MVQFGIAADPEVTKKWIDKPLPDDIAQHSNERGMLSFAHRGPNTRTTQVFINYSNNTHLDSGEAPFAPVGRVLQGWDVVMDIYSEHRDYPDQMLIMREGNEYLDARFPGLEVLKRACFVERIE